MEYKDNYTRYYKAASISSLWRVITSKYHQQSLTVRYRKCYQYVKLRFIDGCKKKFFFPNFRARYLCRETRISSRNASLSASLDLQIEKTRKDSYRLSRLLSILVKTRTRGLMSRIKNDGWQPGEVRLASWNAEDSLNSFPPLSHILTLCRRSPSFRASTSSLSCEFSLVNSTRWSSLSALKKRIDGPSHLKKEKASQGGQAGWEKSGFPSLTRLRYMHRRAVPHWAGRHRRRGSWSWANKLLQ